MPKVLETPFIRRNVNFVEVCLNIVKTAFDRQALLINLRVKLSLHAPDAYTVPAKE